MKQLILLFSIILTSFSSGLAQNNFGSLQGVVTDYKTKDSIPFVNVVLYKNDTVFVAGTRTDFNGKFKFNALQADKYKVVFQSIGYVKHIYEGVVVNPNKITFLSKIEMNSHVVSCGPEYFPSMVDPTANASKTTFTRSEINRMPARW